MRQARAPPSIASVLEIAAVVGSMNVTPSAVATATRGSSAISTPASRPSAIALSTSVRVSPLPGAPRTTVASGAAPARRAS